MVNFFENVKKKNLIKQIVAACDEIKKQLLLEHTIISAHVQLSELLISKQDKLRLSSIELLRKILSEIKLAPAKQHGAVVYLNRARYLIQEYVLTDKKFDEIQEKQNDNNCELECKAVNFKADVLHLQTKIKQLCEQVIDANVSKDSIEYKDFNRKYEKYKIEHQHASDLWQDAVNTLSMNQKSSVVLRMKAELQENARYLDKSFEEFQDAVEEAKLLKQQKNAEFQAYNKTFEQFSETGVSKFDTSNFDKAIEETLLERLAKDYTNEQDFEKVLSNKSSDELLNAIARLQEKLEKLQSSNSTRDNKLQSLYELMQKVYYQLYLDKDVGGDIEKAVLYALSSNPKDLQSASLKLRACIENYCRYNKGVDMADKFLFENNQKVLEKLKTAGFDDATASILENIYCNTNPYIHNAVEDLKDPEIREKEIREAAQTLKQLGIDKYDVVKGMPKFYIAQDQLLATRIKQSDNPTEYASTSQKDGKVNFVNSSLFYLKQAQLKRYDYMKRNGISIPNCNFDGSSHENFMHSVQKFVDSLANSNNVPASTEQVREVACTNAQPTQRIQRVVLPADGNVHQEYFTGKIVYYDQAKKYGKIKNTQSDATIHFFAYNVEGGEDAIQTGVLVEYTVGVNYKGETAKNIRIK